MRKTFLSLSLPSKDVERGRKWALCQASKGPAKGGEFAQESAADSAEIASLRVQPASAVTRNTLYYGCCTGEQPLGRKRLSEQQLGDKHCICFVRPDLFLAEQQQFGLVQMREEGRRGKSLMAGKSKGARLGL